MLITTKVIINKPVKEVWEFFDNSDNMKLWLTGFVEFIPVSGNKGEVGAKAKHIYLQRGRKIELEEEITEKIPYKKFSGILSHTTMASTIDTLFNDLGGKTELISNSNFQFKSFAFKLLSPLMKKSFQKRQDEQLNKLKAVVEG